ncbi:MAG: hypothetical protein CMH46_06075 [Muricauda sp.]|nr:MULTISPECIES: hypothetical protein [unclassified Allomuricauda]MAU15092.1 hypothetical protein [Allomuricauda sp.]|tara:strand:+ start:1063 stop:1434 length:372 start_codon:yes stop_codon:yes gene_type:complete
MDINDILLKAISRNIFVIFCIAITSSLLVSCSGDDSEDDISSVDCQAGTWTEWIQSELTDYSNALNAYAEDPSDQNCSAFKTAAFDYLEALRDIADCVPTANKAAIDQAIDEAESEVANESCD